MLKVGQVDDPLNSHLNKAVVSPYQRETIKQKEMVGPMLECTALTSAVDVPQHSVEAVTTASTLVLIDMRSELNQPIQTR